MGWGCAELGNVSASVDWASILLSTHSRLRGQHNMTDTSGEAEQAAYWGITREQAKDIAHEAAALYPPDEAQASAKRWPTKRVSFHPGIIIKSVRFAIISPHGNAEARWGVPMSRACWKFRG